MTASEPWRTTGHVDSSAHTQDVHTKHEGGSALRDKVLWVTGLVSKVNAYSILTVVIADIDIVWMILELILLRLK